jgi:hypothetical protein
MSLGRQCIDVGLALGRVHVLFIRRIIRQRKVRKRRHDNIIKAGGKNAEYRPNFDDQLCPALTLNSLLLRQPNELNK